MGSPVYKRLCSIALVVLLAALHVAASLVAGAQTGEGGVILLLPFRLMTDREEPELRSFAEHIADEIRVSVSTMSSNYKVVEQTFSSGSSGGGDPLTTEEEIKQVATDAAADFVVYGSISARDYLYHMKGFMWDTGNQRMAVTIDLKVPNVHALPSVLQFFLNGISKRLQGAPNIPFYKAGVPGALPAVHPTRLRTLVGIAGEEGPWRSPEIPGAMKGLDIGDLAGGKQNETVFVGDSGITIGRFEKNGLRPLTQFSKSPAVFLSVQAEDLDGDGAAELIVCSQLPEGIESEVFRYLNRNLTLIETLPNMILANVPNPENPKSRLLLGQRTDVEDMFSGEMISFSMRNGELVPEGRVQLPPGTLVLSYTAGEMQRQEYVQVIIDQHRRLLVFDTNNRLLSTLDGDEFALHRKMTVKTPTGPRDVLWPGRIMISDSFGGGQGELMVARNSGDKSEIQGFHWGGSALEKKWNTPSMEGIISDFKIADFKNNGGRCLVLLLLKPDPLLGVSGQRSTVFAYDFLP